MICKQMRLSGKFIILLVFMAVSTIGCANVTPTPTAAKAASDINANTVNFVALNGQLKVVGTQLCNKNGQPIQLKGMSSHGINWFPQFVNANSLQYLRDAWGANVFRVAMYTHEGPGYITNPAENKAKVEQAIDDAIRLGIYIIVDWHILSDNDPNMFKGQAKDFFNQISAKYKNVPNVIYEICNEPNGNTKWASHIKPYAEEVIPVIRANSPNALVIVGTGNWCQEVLDAAYSPLGFNNIMYACHFYAGTHTQWLRDKVSAALDKGIAIFVSEWGTSEASGNGGPYAEETQKWLDFLDTKKISWCNWSLCDKDETSAALRPGANPNGGWNDSELSPSGKLVKAAMLAGKPTSNSVQTPQNTASTQAKNTSVVRLQMFSGNTGTTINSIYPRFKLENTSSSALDLSQVKIRYYYTIDGEKPQNFFCDWSNIGNTNVTGTFVKMSNPQPDADYYLEVGFTGGAGSLPPGGSIEVQTRFAKTDWSNYNQANDFSFDAAANNYSYWEKIAVYISGNLVFGIER